MTSREKTASAQLFLVELDLADLSGHFFNQSLGFRLAAEQAGLKCTTLLPRRVDASLAEGLDGKRVIDLDLIHQHRFDFELDQFAEGHRRLKSLWKAVEEAGVTRQDMLLITSARPVVIYSLGAWLAQLAAGQRPAVFIRFFDHAYINPETMNYTELSWKFRFASKDLSLRAGQERVFFTANNKSMIPALSALCDRRLFRMPLPKHYGELTELSIHAKNPVIYVHLNVRSGSLLREIEPIIRRVLSQRPQAVFLIKYCLNALQPAAIPNVSQDLAKRAVELIPSEQSHADYLHTVLRSDIVLLPYEAIEYKALASGVFAEAAALGKVIVYPNHTWMSDQVLQGRATGVGFDSPKRSAICAAVLRALDQLPLLTAAAKQRSQDFREENSCRRNLDLMRALAVNQHDMRPTYMVGTIINFRNAIQSRFYMEGGWSDTETKGVWTEGPKAELRIRLEETPVDTLRGTILLTPFLVKGLARQVDVFVNESRTSQWNFPARQRYPIRLDIVIPAEIAVTGEIHIRFEVTDPISPKSLGVSEDRRRLGVMLHEICFTEAPHP